MEQSTHTAPHDLRRIKVYRIPVYLHFLGITEIAGKRVWYEEKLAASILRPAVSYEEAVRMWKSDADEDTIFEVWGRSPVARWALEGQDSRLVKIFELMLEEIPLADVGEMAILPEMTEEFLDDEDEEDDEEESFF